MKRSTSFVQGRITLMDSVSPAEERPQLDFNKFIYINTEEAHKQKHTIFHSPFKGGKKNPNYTNPSFMSSDVFYPRDYSANEHSKSKPKVALIPTKNDIIYQEQYKSRMMRKSYSGTCLNKGLKNDKSKKILQSFDQNISRQVERDRERQVKRINNNILRKIEDSKQLRYQIELMRRSPPKHSQEYYKNVNPVYLKERPSYINRTLKKQASKRQLIQEMNRAIKRKAEQKWQKQIEKRNDKVLIDKEAQRFYAGIRSSNDFQKQKAKLLSELLLQQIFRRS